MFNGDKLDFINCCDNLNAFNEKMAKKRHEERKSSANENCFYFEKDRMK